MSAPSSISAWEATFRENIAGIKAQGANIPYEQSVGKLRELLKKGTLRHTDIRDNPEKFMAAHRLLAEFATTLGPGFWIRFTVHYNLFAGTVVALGNPEQVALLDAFQKEGKIGCFGLTEVFAGVNSGMIVQTTATWNPEKQMFLIHSPDKGAYKNWISQGLVADLCVAVADLRVGGQSYGPHAFLMDIRKGGKLVDGVEMGDMGHKTIGNDLDNAWIAFSNVWLPKTALLSKYGEIVNDKYEQKVQGIRTMDMIGQRLYTGRTVIARSAIVFSRMLYASTRDYTDKKKCWAPKGATMHLSEIPQLQALYVEADQTLAAVDRFVSIVESRLSECLRKEQIPPADLTEAVAAAKVKSVETAINLCWRLKQEVGSYALMHGGGFDQLDYLQCCKFAEGDSRILMQKMARDRVKAFQKGFRGTEEEAGFCERITGSNGKPAASGPDAHLEVYGLAEAMVKRIVKDFVAGSTSKL
eukprot:TRINITY_DN93176_c0_g1_i1.p1 TRINITY_DN93176_c0_g1~~TRINITY_DN93176_c0_g1_i1.p1  ORF type:complete len:471 (+),score=96.47 TRINITY_DN93176_c0_g1_i1:78-1490(+)